MNPLNAGRRLWVIEDPKATSHQNLGMFSVPSTKKWPSSVLNNNFKIEFDDLVKDYRIQKPEIFANYLLQVWKDLTKRSEIPWQGIQKLTFMTYYDLPGIISDRLFSNWDKSKNGFLSARDFIQGMTGLFSGSFEILSSFIFKFYDFDQDGFITKEDLRVVLSYVPLQKTYCQVKMKYEQEDFNDRIESQIELHKLLNQAFGKSEKMNEKEFINLIDNVNSDIFIFILMFWYEKRPFTNESITVFLKKTNETLNTMFSCNTPKIEPHKIASPSMKSKFVSPSLKNRTLNWTKQNSILNAYSGKAGAPQLTKMKAFNRTTESIPEEKKTELTKVKPQRKFRKILNDIEDIPQSKVISIQIIKESEETSPWATDSDKEEENETWNTNYTDGDSKTVTYSGYLLKLTTGAKKLKTMYFKWIGKDFYFFKEKDDQTYKGMHNLSGIYIRENPKVTIEGKSLFNFSVCYPQKARTYYTEQEEEYLNWVRCLSLVLDSKKLWDQYDIQDKIGKGKFGWVKLAIHKETKRKVAIKIMAKKNMALKDFELAKTEIDILKVCQHPNIIKLYDVIDTKDYIYIIMEYCSGKDLFTYIEARNYCLPEKRAAEIIHQLSMAVYYIHSYGIVHRDWKPENIWMTDNSDTADIRLLDFGWSKIMTPSEKCNEPYGTLSYVAPEVLLEIPYDKRVDLWTIGIITYWWLCGYLPFDDEHSEREIARQTIQDPIQYPKENWDDISKEVKDLINKTVKKKPEERLNIENILEHPWFKKFGLVPDFRKKDDRNETCNFIKYATDKKK